ncbi:MAG: type 1 glutamine amidotransferase [Candidatus Lambdaproteobacteria bacterium]|nr:type 1 glutamine amidotransferase [Candidatus Lambdaproteobacteria bacterium]
MRFAVIQCGSAVPGARRRLGDFGAMFTALLAEPGQTWDVLDAREEWLPRDPARYAGYLVTGSTRAAYDCEPWILRLIEGLGAVHRARVPLLGVCFGSQCVAAALGGGVVANPLGWELGLREVHLTSAGRQVPGLERAPAPLRILETHMDIVAPPPPGAIVLASSARTPIELFALGTDVLGLQGHPEFDNDTLAEVIALMGARLPAERAEEGRRSLAAQPHRDVFRDLLRAFLRRDPALLAALAGLQG